MYLFRKQKLWYEGNLLKSHIGRNETPVSSVSSQPKLFQCQSTQQRIAACGSEDDADGLESALQFYPRLADGEFPG